jgi:hypothetical protein
VSTAILRHQLSVAERELFDLRYLDPTDEQFARNVITNLFPTDADGHARALVTIYAAPQEPVEVQHPRLIQRLQDPGLMSYEPAAAQTGALVPGLLRPIAGGAMAHDGKGDFTRMGSALVLRTAGSVELIDGDATASGRDGASGLFLRHTLVHTAQVLNYLVAYGETLQRADWSLLVNVRDANSAALTDFHRRFERVFRVEPSGSLERHLQFRASVQPADENAARATVRRLDAYLSYAYGFREPRGHAANGWLIDP